MKRLLLGICLMIGCHHADSGPTAPLLNTAALTGKVTNVTNAVPLERVEVAVTQSGQTMTTLTSSTGTYSFFTGVLPGSVALTAKATGYQTLTATTIVSAGSNRYDIQLRPSP